MTKNKRFTVMITPEIEEQIKQLRKTDKYCMMPISEIVRNLVQQGIDAMSDKEPA